MVFAALDERLAHSNLSFFPSRLLGRGSRLARSFSAKLRYKTLLIMASLFFPYATGH
jgi:hypothetical protein